MSGRSKIGIMMQMKDDYLKKLEKAASLTRDEAKKLLLEEIEKDLADELAQRLNQAREDYTARSAEIARDILVDAMAHGATSYTAEYSVSIVTLPNDATKGSIIGQGGRNIAAFERATGVEIEMEEGNSLRLSCFDSVRREVARRSLDILMKDGRIHPGRIEDVVTQTRKQVDLTLVEEGNKICAECGVFNLDAELVKLIGKYRFRFSYGQNLGIHTIEETKIGVQMALDLGLSEELVEQVRLGCLLHDIGKVVTDEEGTHVQLGVDLLKKHGISAVVIAAVAEHHEDKPFSSAVSRIVWIADAISGSRPGARYEPHDAYTKRMKQIEEIGKSFKGVDEVFAFQAGREVRVIVRPDLVSDSELTVLVAKIREQLEKQVQYAGQIKVTAIREVRTTDITKAK